MNVRLRPDLEKFVAEKVEASKYASCEEVVEAGIARLMIDPAPPLDDQTLAAIEEGEAQGDRGELRPWEELKAELLAKYLPR